MNEVIYLKNRPNLFIVGAPKCGTTSLSEYLRSHPDFFVLKEKETHYFCFDFNKDYPRPRNEDDYLRLFLNGIGKKIIVDASPWYLHSNCAIKNAFEFNPSAKFIVMVRNPLEAVPSLHRQLINNYDEDDTDLLSAWNQQLKRKQGENIPRSCRESKLLQYKDIYQLGKQIEDLYAVVPSEQIMVILFDDFKINAAEVYNEVLEFVNVGRDERSSFPIINGSFQWRFRFFSDFVIDPPSFVHKFGEYFLNKTGLKRLGIVRLLYIINNKLNRKKLVREEIPEEVKQIFREVFADDIGLLSRLINRDLTKWLK